MICYRCVLKVWHDLYYLFDYVCLNIVDPILLIKLLHQLIL